MLTEAELALLPRPKERGLLVPHFASLAAAMDALAACLELQPSAVELMDHMLIELRPDNLALQDVMKHCRPGRQAAAHGRVQRRRPGRGRSTGSSACKPAGRGAGAHRHDAGRGRRRPRSALEPAAGRPCRCCTACPATASRSRLSKTVPSRPRRLPEFVARFRELLQRHGTDGAFYGHASVGCLHIRPLLNLKDPDDVARMRRIAEEVTDLVLEFGGSLSGEHGDGLARSEWNKKMFGPVVYEAFCQVKQAFDPRNLLNPGRVVHAPPMTENLRYPPGYAPAEPETLFDYSKQEGFVRSVEMCNGNGACRKLQGGTMCPSFRATLRREGQHARAGQCACAWPWPANSRWRACKPGSCRRARPVPDVQGVQGRVSQQRGHGQAQGGVPALYYRNHPRPLGELLMRPSAGLQSAGGPFALAGQLLAVAAAVALGPGETGRHRPPPQPAAAARLALPALVSLGTGVIHGRGPARPGAAARRLLHHLQRAAPSAGPPCACWSEPATGWSWPTFPAVAGRC